MATPINETLVRDLAGGGLLARLDLVVPDELGDLPFAQTGNENWRFKNRA